ncbi:ABC transporter ATP-binding protein [Clostridium mediterraneense]|uniref:ABC transporter ATP-binding protein n=1 Tax=Clostridium mediterraneense TaxID=1805472 RepID=UPI00082ED2D8|nr:ABC transporter ATP-binding protein [Clostridium mediterraneense]
MSVVIEVKNLKKMYKMYGNEGEKLISVFKKRKYEEFYALNGVSFTIGKGECVGIIGHNGAGKSTLLKILTGVAFPTSGEVIINGKISSLLELGSGFNPELSGMENIYFNGALNGMSTSEIDAVKDEIIEFADIGDFIHQPVKSYSSGMFARLAFAVAINIDPDILIVDEILSVGDVGFQVKCMAKFEEFKKAGKTILYVSHGLGTVKKFCDRAIWLQRGEVMDDGNSVIVVERYYNINFNPATIENIEESKSSKLKSLSLTPNKEKISYREDINLEFEYELNEELEAPRIIFEIRKTDYEPGTTRGSDQFVCAFDSVDNNIRIKGLKGSNKFKLSLEDISLVAGVYYFDVIVIDKGETLYRKINACSFTMDDKYRGEGFLILDHSWNK